MNKELDKETRDLLSFKAICVFVKDLTTVYEKNHPLALYNRLLEKTPINNSKIINKHVVIFEEFLKKNKDAIVEKNLDKFETEKISYNETVLIQVKRFLSETDEETRNQIYNHLQYISSLVLQDEATLFKKLLKDNLQNNKNAEKETEFLGNLINKVENTVDISKVDNPLNAVNQLLSSGVLNDMVSSLQSGLSNGNLDLGKLLGVVQNVVGSSGGRSASDPSGGLGSSDNSSSSDGPSGNIQMPDLSSMMGMLPMLMGGLGGRSASNPSGGPDLSGLLGGLMQNMQNNMSKQSDNTTE